MKTSPEIWIPQMWAPQIWALQIPYYSTAARALNGRSMKSPHVPNMGTCAQYGHMEIPTCAQYGHMCPIWAHVPNYGQHKLHIAVPSFARRWELGNNRIGAKTRRDCLLTMIPVNGCGLVRV